MTEERASLLVVASGACKTLFTKCRRASNADGL